MAAWIDISLANFCFVVYLGHLVYAKIWSNYDVNVNCEDIIIVFFIVKEW